MESIDDLLSQLKVEYEEKDKPSQPKTQQPEKGEQARKEPVLPILPSQIQRKNNVAPSSGEYSLLSDLKAEFEAQDKEAELKKQQELKEEQLRQERIKQQQQQAVKKEAEVWLKKLDPKSTEGLWFEEFAYSYPSKLEAAIDYLQALRETRS